MKRWLFVILCVVLLAGLTTPAAAQSDIPQWAIDMVAKLDRIEAQNTLILQLLQQDGVKLAQNQGQVIFTCDVDHQACFQVRNTHIGGYGMYVRGEAVGFVAEGTTVGNWNIGQVIGQVNEGTRAYGVQNLGGLAGVQSKRVGAK